MSKSKRLPKPLRDLHDVRIKFECYSLVWVDDMRRDERQLAAAELLKIVALFNGIALRLVQAADLAELDS